MATGTRVFRTLTVRRGRVGWASLRRHRGTRGAIRTTHKWPATPLCDTATSNQPSIEPGGQQATRAARERFPCPSLRGGSVTRPTTSPSSPSKVGGTRSQRRRPSRLSSSCGGSSAGRASSAGDLGRDTLSGLRAVRITLLPSCNTALL
eukprot:scaffold126091_cov48-Phaeocystis_antarctica.AAC.1